MRLNKLIGAKIRTRRHEQSLSLQAVAAKLGIGFQQIYKYEMGENLIPACRMTALAQMLKVQISYFFE
jgi:transcriptional regulator with XRE-family HTH domain